MTVENDPAGYLLLKTHPNIVFLTFYLIDVILEKESLKKTAYIDEKTPPGRQPGTLLHAYRLRTPTMSPYTSCFAKTHTKILPQDIYRVAFRSEKCLFLSPFSGFHHSCCSKKGVTRVAFGCTRPLMNSLRLRSNRTTRSRRLFAPENTS